MKRPQPSLLLLAYLGFVSLGLPDTVLGVAWPSLRDAFELSQAAMGAVLIANVSAYVVSGLVAGQLTARLGVGGLLAASSGLVALGLVGYAAAPRWALFLPMGALVGLGSGAIDASLNGYAARHFPVRHVNWLHACWSVGATAGPVIMTAALARSGSYHAGYAVLAITLGGMALAFMATRRSWDDPASDHVRGVTAARAAQPPPVGVRATLRRGMVWLQIAVFLVYTGLESSAGQWCFTVLREARGLSVEAAGSWTAAYWASLTAGRALLGFVIERLGPDRLLRVATLAAAAGAAAFAWDGGLPGRLGLLLLGASLAPVYPTLMSRTPARLGPASAHAVGFQVSAATLGVALGPGFIGLLVERLGLGVVGSAVTILAVALCALHEALLRANQPATTALGSAAGRRP